MKLFNTKTLARHVSGVAAMPADHLERLSNWAELIGSGRIMTLKETALHGDFKSTIVEGVLGYTGAAQGAAHTVTAEKTVLRGSVDLALGHFSPDTSQIIAPFELKGAKTKDLDAIMPGRAKSPVQQAWEYATNARGVQWVLVSNYLQIRLYGFGEGTQAYEVFDLAKLVDPREYARFMLLLSARNLLSGRTREILEESRKADKDITNQLYVEYKTLRTTLIKAIQADQANIDPLKAIAAAQTILDRVLFTAFAEDTGLLPRKILARAFEHADPFNPHPVWDNFKGLFTAIDRGNAKLDVPPYNGGLFAPNALIDNLSLPDHVCKGFRNIGAYDFASEVSVTVLGHIFEQSIADVERLQAIARGEATEEKGKEKKTSGTTGKRKRDGVVYTPDYIARFIVGQTLGAHLEGLFDAVLGQYAKKGATAQDKPIHWKRKGAELEAWEAYRDSIQRLRIVDPACGSGVFLVMAFDMMKAELTRVNTKIGTLKGEYVGDLFDPDTEILTNNLFGVDVNAESIEIAKLSLWVKTARRGKPLDSLNRNFWVGDSLIEDSSYAYRKHGFSWKTAFARVFADGGFDVVLGNPPYVRQELLGGMKPYLQTRFSVYHGVADLYCYFFERGLRLLKPGGRMGYISSSTFFKTGSGKPLRNYLRTQSTMEHIVDFGDLQIFEGVTTYPAILVMRNDTPAPKHNLQFWRVDTLPEVNFVATYDRASEPYPQNALTDNSWELENPALKALRDKIIRGKPTLKEVYGSPYRGVLTGRNEAFVIDRATRDRLVAQDPKSAEVLKPFLEGKDLKRWRAEGRDLWLIFTRRGIDIDAYPAIKAHLEQYREILEPKPTYWQSLNTGDKWKGRKSGSYKWYEIQDAVDYYDEFEKPKIVYPHFSQGRKFHTEYSSSYSNDKSYIIPIVDYFLLGLLNSNTIWSYLQSVCSAMRGGEWRLELRNYNIETIPIPNATDAQKQALGDLAQTCQTAAEKRYGVQQALRRRIPDLCPPDRDAKLSTKLKNWWIFPDFKAFHAEVKKTFKTDIPLAERSDWEDWITRDRHEIARLSADIITLEAQINTLVYDLFDLTPDEINLLQENI